jgi:transcriptional regulator with XRE-family HTH domain
MKTIYDHRYVEIISLLRAARERAGLSQEEIARRLGKSQPFLAKVETGERRLDLLEAFELCRVLGITLESVTPADLQHLLRAPAEGLSDG